MEILFVFIMLITFLVIGGIIILLIKLLLVTKTPREVYQDSKSLIQEAKKSGSDIYKNLTRSDDGRLQDIDEELFSIAYSEIINSTRNEGLWVKSLVLAEGDEDKQETEYIKLRVVQLSNEINKNNE
jgi:hypothetical protein